MKCSQALFSTAARNTGKRSAPQCSVPLGPSSKPEVVFPFSHQHSPAAHLPSLGRAIRVLWVPCSLVRGAEEGTGGFSLSNSHFQPLVPCVETYRGEVGLFC